jgi:hypothetical protein
MRPGAPLLAVLLLAVTVSPLAFAAEETPETTAAVRDKVFYLQTSDLAKNVGTFTTRNLFSTEIGTFEQEIQSQQRVIAEWYLFPELAGPVTLEGTSTLVLWFNSTSAGPSTPDWDIQLQRVSPNGTLTTIVNAPGLGPTPGTNPAVWEEKTVTFPVNNSGTPLQAGDSLRLWINLVGSASVDYMLSWGSALRNSRLILPTRDYIQIIDQGSGGIWTADGDRQPVSNFDPTAANQDLYIFATIQDPFGGYDIVWVNITMRDPNGTIIPALDDVTMALDFGFFNSYQSVFAVMWNYSGWPSGQYTITITAVDQTGNEEFLSSGSYGVHLETDTGATFSIGLPPHSVWVHVVDSAGGDLVGAAVEAQLGGAPADSGTTNGTGLIELMLFPASYDVVVYWTGAEVASEAVNVVGDVPVDNPVEIVALVVSPTLRIVDVGGVELEPAEVLLAHPNGTVDAVPRITDSQGEVGLTLVAGGAYGVSVQWRGRTVVDTTVTMVSSTAHTVIASVFYVNFLAEDQTGQPVAGVFVLVSDPAFALILDTQITDVDGRATSRIPAGDVMVNATFFGVKVYPDTDLPVSDNVSFPFTIDVYQIGFRIIDSGGAELEAASVSVSSPALARAANTGADGRVTFTLPAGNHSVNVLWRTLKVFDGTVDIDGSTVLYDLHADVHYLTVRTEDREGDSLVGAYVTAKSGNRTWGADFTGTEGLRPPRAVPDDERTVGRGLQ